MNWQKPAESTPPAVESQWALEANPSANTKYVTYNNGDGTYTAMVMEKAGTTGTKNTLIGEGGGLTDLQNLCDKDWATGVRK